MSVEVSVGYMSVGWACGRARGRGALGERPSGEGVEWEERGGEWDGRGVRVGWALGFGDYLDAGLPVAKSAPNPYTTRSGSPATEPSGPVTKLDPLDHLQPIPAAHWTHGGLGGVKFPPCWLPDPAGRR
jgi:hypothetical protein